MITGRVRRSVSPASPPSSSVRARGVSRLPNALAPRSRRLAIATATTTSVATSAAIGRNPIKLEPVRTWISSIQPRGLAHLSQDRLASESATILIR